MSLVHRAMRSSSRRASGALTALAATCLASMAGGCDSDASVGGAEPVIVDCDAGALVAALAGIGTAPATLRLTNGCTYTLQQPDNYFYGPTGLPPIQSEVTILGNGAVIERASTAPPFRIFFVAGPPTPSPEAGERWGLRIGALTLRDVTLRGGVARGGSGGSQGGGGLGAGGGMFVQGRARLEAVTITGCRAQGGSGGDFKPQLGGGGGMGGDGAGSGGGFKEPGSDAQGGGFLGGEGGKQTGEGGLGQGLFLGSDWDMNNLGSGGGKGALGSRGRFASMQAIGDGGSGGDLAGGGAGFGGKGGKAFMNAGTSGGGGGGGFGGGGGRGLVDGRDSGGGGGVGGGGGAGDIGGGGGFGGGGGGATYAGGDGGFGGGGGGGGGPDPMGFGASAFGGGSGGDGAGGGGLGAGGAVFVHQGQLTVVNATLVENAAVGGPGGKGATMGIDGQGGSGFGGALFNVNGKVDFVHATVANNTVQVGSGLAGGAAAGGAVYSLGFGQNPVDGSDVQAMLLLRNSVLSGSKGGPDLLTRRDTSRGQPLAVTDGIGTGSARNLVQTAMSEDGAAQTLGMLSADPQLGALDTSGPTPTLSPSAGSPLIGAGEPGVCTGPESRSRDQRGQGRSSRCTLGAVEAEPTSEPPPSDMEPASGCAVSSPRGGSRGEGVLGWGLFVVALSRLLRARFRRQAAVVRQSMA